MEFPERHDGLVIEQVNDQPYKNKNIDGLLVQLYDAEAGDLLEGNYKLVINEDEESFEVHKPTVAFSYINNPKERYAKEKEKNVFPDDSAQRQREKRRINFKKCPERNKTIQEIKCNFAIGNEFGDINSREVTLKPVPYKGKVKKGSDKMTGLNVVQWLISITSDEGQDYEENDSTVYDLAKDLEGTLLFGDEGDTAMGGWSELNTCCFK